VSVYRTTTKGDIDVYVDLFNINPIAPTASYGSDSDNDDSVVLSLCSPDGNNSFVVYITVRSFLDIAEYMVVPLSQIIPLSMTQINYLFYIIVRYSLLELLD